MSLTEAQMRLGQVMTPAWAARELWAAHFADVKPGQVGAEPTCGDGRMLQAIPSDIEVYACEIEPRLAEDAHRRTGRTIVVGDVLTALLPPRIDFVFGNFPFSARFAARLLSRLAECMPDGARCGVIQPAYFLQSTREVLRWNKTWTIEPEILPRTLFPRLIHPVVFATFMKDPAPVLKGMRLFLQANSIEDLRRDFRDELEQGEGLWKPVVRHAYRVLGGGVKHLSEIYEVVGKNRPSKNPWWKEKVRQTLQQTPGYAARGGGYWEELGNAA